MGMSFKRNPALSRQNSVGRGRSQWPTHQVACTSCDTLCSAGWHVTGWVGKPGNALCIHASASPPGWSRGGIQSPRGSPDWAPHFPFQSFQPQDQDIGFIDAACPESRNYFPTASLTRPFLDRQPPSLLCHWLQCIRSVEIWLKMKMRTVHDQSGLVT